MVVVVVVVKVVEAVLLLRGRCCVSSRRRERLHPTVLAVDAMDESERALLVDSRARGTRPKQGGPPRGRAAAAAATHTLCKKMDKKCWT